MHTTIQCYKYESEIRLLIKIVVFYRNMNRYLKYKEWHNVTALSCVGLYIYRVGLGLHVYLSFCNVSTRWFHIERIFIARKGGMTYEDIYTV